MSRDLNGTTFAIGVAGLVSLAFVWRWLASRVASPSTNTNPTLPSSAQPVPGATPGEPPPDAVSLSPQANVVFVPQTPGYPSAGTPVSVYVSSDTLGVGTAQTYQGTITYLAPSGTYAVIQLTAPVVLGGLALVPAGGKLWATSAPSAYLWQPQVYQAVRT